MASEAFQDRVLNDLLPAFCERPNREWCREGFQKNWSKVNELDAADFIRALDAGLIEHLGGGLYRAPRSFASESFFWHGPKHVIQRTLTLWIEPIITVAVLARLHFEFGWPKALIGTQSRHWEFDVAAYRASDLQNEYVACEVKKTQSEVEQMIGLMHKFARGGGPDSSLMKAKEVNAYRKLLGLKARRAPIFWAVGPGNLSYVFQVIYDHQGDATLIPADRDALIYPDA